MSLVVKGRDTRAAYFVFELDDSTGIDLSTFSQIIGSILMPTDPEIFFCSEAGCISVGLPSIARRLCSPELW